MHQRACQHEPTLHPARQRTGAVARLLGERERVEQLARSLTALPARHPEVAAVVVERLLAREEPVDVQVLRREAYGQARLLVVLDRVVAEDPDRAGRGPGEAGGAVD